MRRARRAPCAIAVVVVALCTACTAIVGEPPLRPGAEAPIDPLAVGTTPLRRLSRVEYTNVVRDLLGIDDAGRALPLEPNGTSGFPTPGRISDTDARLYLESAERAAQLVELATLVPCAQTATSPDAEATCASEFVREFVARAYRRPIDDEEVDAYLAFYRDELRGAQQMEFVPALRAIVETVLQTPDFLYHTENAPAPDAEADGPTYRLTPYQLASRLSFFLWRTMPDEALLASAADGRLVSEEDVEREARRMLDDPRARATVAEFHRDWLSLDAIGGAPRDSRRYPAWNPELAASMVAEVEQVASWLVLDRRGTVDDLLTTRTSFADANLAALYDVAPSDRAIELPASRGGILTRAAVLAVGSNAVEGDPTKRGRLIRERLLCTSLPPPPADIPELPPPSPGTITVRERHERHVSDPACAGCHALTDPLGFAFAHFDAIGRWQDSEDGLAIDPSGSLVRRGGRVDAFADHAGLIALLTGNEEVRHCMMLQWVRFALRRAEVAEDASSLQTIFERFSASNFELRELLVSIAVSRTFRHRAPRIGERR